MLSLKKTWKAIASAVVCSILYILQAVYLNYILITHKKLWYITLVPDCLTLILVLLALDENVDLLKGIFQQSNIVLVLAGSSAIFVLYSTAVLKYEDLVFSGAIDMIDGTINLNFLLEGSNYMLSFRQANAVLAIACVTLILPVFHLLLLGKSSRTATILTAVYNLVLNIPIFIQRIILFHQGFGALSVFVFKNIIQIGKNLLHVIEEIYDLCYKRDRRMTENSETQNVEEEYEEELVLVKIEGVLDGFEWNLDSLKNCFIRILGIETDRPYLQAKTVNLLNDFQSEEVCLQIEDIDILKDHCYAAGLLLGFPIVYKTGDDIIAATKTLEDIPLKVVQINVSLFARRRCESKTEVKNHKLCSFSFPNEKKYSIYLKNWWENEKLRILQKPGVHNVEMTEKVVTLSSIVL
ncbi:DgyrCDS4854 [Dimorphilus gyrociliatus]|uniref:DgyrCDS4854 n=1 Tax=Dimorphilus gyrociliatus TaxID=2664684 RepID=A0A7I8VI98_9ANNE|nr:DgyrCDS4854 [Dimorphilus gyrociliatus]